MKVHHKIEVRIVNSLLMWHYNTSVKLIRANKKQPIGIVTNSELRQYVDVVLAWYSELTLKEIGFVTRRDHSSVNHSTSKVKQQLELFGKYGKKTEYLKNFEIFESRFIIAMSERNINVTRRFRSYKDELKSAEICHT